MTQVASVTYIIGAPITSTQREDWRSGQFSFPTPLVTTQIQAVPSQLFIYSRPPTLYYHRAFDTGTQGLVFWSSSGSPNLSPSPSITSPTYTGSLVDAAVLLVILQ